MDIAPIISEEPLKPAIYLISTTAWQTFHVDAGSPGCDRDAMPSNNKSITTGLATVLITLSLTGCTGISRSGDLAGVTVDVRNELLMFDGHSGDPIRWEDLMTRVASADVIIIGEQHDDAVGHAVQRAVIEDAVARGSNLALSMEMLDRSEQSIVDDYVAELIDREKFYELTASTEWRKVVNEYLAGEINKSKFKEQILRIGWPDWETNYQPIIDAAKDGGARIVAANAPWLRYTKLITKDGYEKLETLTDEQRRLIDTPEVPESGKYRERFWEVMVDRAEGEEPKESESDGDDPEVEHIEMSDEDVLRSFHSQMMYDATMAGSMAEALKSGAEKVIHLVGQFHSDFEGGTVMELRRRVPDARILLISMQKESAAALREEDTDRADIVIYTGARED